MFEQRYCNYQRSDQQRLGFLKLVSWAGEGVRGGPEEIKSRLDEAAQYQKRQRAVAAYDYLNVELLLKRPEVPSWLPGIVPKLYHRLVTWAQAVGIIAPSGQLSEWANVLNVLAPDRNLRDFNSCNPFVLSPAERMFFVRLLFYHDQVLPILVEILGRLRAGTRIGVRDACVLVSKALAAFFDSLQAQGPEGLKMRVALRETLEKITKEYDPRGKLPHALINPSSRPAAIENLASSRRRVLTAERQAVCRLEQLTDLGFLTKDNPTAPAQTDHEIDAARTAWAWYTTEHLPAAASMLHATELEQFLRQSWVKFCTALFPQSEFRAPADKHELASFLDRALPMVRRQIGPVQVHPWAMLGCILAAKAGVIIEVNDVHVFLSALHSNPRTNRLVRLGGNDSFRGRNVVLPVEGLKGVLAGIGNV